MIVLPRFTVDQHPEEKGHVGNVESIKPESVLEAIQSLGFWRRPGPYRSAGHVPTSAARLDP